MKLFKKALIALLSLVLVFVLVAAGYVAYMQMTFYRIEDKKHIEVQNNMTGDLKSGTEYSLLTYNIGFGAYSPEYSFFMDKGSFPGEEITKGKYGKAISLEDVNKNTNGSIDIIKKQNTDFIFLQEVDEKAHRSYFVNQEEKIKKAMSDYSTCFFNNFHSPFLILPINDMHGAVQAGIMTLSKYKVQESIRRSLPVDMSFITKFTDLDRCLGVNRYKVDNGKELILINTHLSAYDEGGKIRALQFEMLNNIISEEYEKGNYVIVGGDFNHALLGSNTMYPTKQDIPDWIAVLADDALNSNSHIVRADNIEQVATCRACNIPYEKGVNYVSTIDGFIISNNVEARAENIDYDFSYSDHNPVKLTFVLN